MQRQPLSFCWLVPLLFTACAAAESAPLGAMEVADVAEDDDAPLAPQRDGAPAPLVVALPELVLEIDRAVEVERSEHGQAWRVRGGSSVEIVEASSWVPDDAFGRVELSGPRAFVFVIEEPADRNTLLSGMPVFLLLRTRDGAEVHAAIWLRPRLVVHGGRELRFATPVSPVWVGGDVAYRGRLAAPRRALVTVLGAAAPTLAEDGEGSWRLDWTFESYSAGLGQVPPHVRATATSGSRVVESAAELSARVGRVGLTRRDPREVWPVTCEPAVRACLAAMPPDAVDAGACGSYRQVLACGGPAGARAPR